MTFASGKKIAGDTIVTTVFTSGDPTTGKGVAELTDAAGGAVGFSFECVFTDSNPASGDCWSRIVGEAGPYKGRVGTATWHFTINGTKDATVGVGQWNN